jgi:ABC-type uncharacterized transport system substrate-binding protein
MTKQINAVAIGKADAPVNQIYNGANLGPPMRQYINGLVRGMQTTWNWTLSNAPGQTNFFINYWEITEATLSTAQGQAQVFGGDVIFAMSSTVVRYAQQYNNTPAMAANPIGIVGVVSDPQQENFYNDPHICGFSAQRHQAAARVFRKFVESVSPNLTTVVLLHKAKYNPSQEALKHITDEGANSPRVNLVPLSVNTPADITRALHNLPIQPQLTGVLVLPVDMFFAKGDDIFTLVQHTGIGNTLTQYMPTFFFAPDWVRNTSGLTPDAAAAASAFGAYGVPQETCGFKMADMVYLVLTTAIPANPASRWTHAVANDFVWIVNTTVAEWLGLTPNPNVPPDKTN